MKKYLLSMFCLMFLVALAPISMKAEAKNATTYTYTAPEELTAADMAAAEVIGMGTVQVDLTQEYSKLYKVNVSAYQVYRFRTANYGESMGDYSLKLFDADGKYLNGSDYEYADDCNGDVFFDTKDAVYYLLVYSNESVDTYFTLSDGMFRDNVSQKSLEGTDFGFVPSVSGKYAFTVQSPYQKSVSIEISGGFEDENWSYKEGESKDYSSTLEMDMTAGKFYYIHTDVYGPYTLTLTKAPAADAVIDQINKLGAITANSGAAVDAARAAYNALTPAEQKLVSNLATLEAAEKAYADATRPAVGRGKVKALKSTKAKQVLVKWKKVSGANGYQVTYSLKKGFKKAKTVNVSASKAKVTLKKLKSGKVYYVKVRAYKVYRGQTYYGAYSKVKKIKVK